MLERLTDQESHPHQLKCLFYYFSKIDVPLSSFVLLIPSGISKNGCVLCSTMLKIEISYFPNSFNFCMIKSVTLSVPPLRVISPLKNKSFSSLFAPFLAIPRLCNFAVHLKHILLRYLLPLASPDSDIGFGMFSSVSIYTFEICTGSSRLANDRILHLCLHFYCYIFQYFP